MTVFPKRPGPLTAAQFQDPGAEYRGTPFWSWNCTLELPELLRQIEVLKRMGYGGFHIHVRTGMSTPYLSRTRAGSPVRSEPPATSARTSTASGGREC